VAVLCRPSGFSCLDAHGIVTEDTRLVNPAFGIEGEDSDQGRRRGGFVTYIRSFYFIFLGHLFWSFFLLHCMDIITVRAAPDPSFTRFLSPFLCFSLLLIILLFFRCYYNKEVIF